MRVVQAGDRLRFAFEAAPAFRIGGQMLGQHLNGHSAIQAGVARLVNLTHSACPNLGSDVEVAEPGTDCESHTFLVRKVKPDDSRIIRCALSVPKQCQIPTQEHATLTKAKG